MPRFRRPTIAPRASAKPPSRALEHILAGEDAATPTGQRDRSPAKTGAGKHYGPIRLFDDSEPVPTGPSPEKIKTNPKKYNHFEFGDGEDALPLKLKTDAVDKTDTKTKHQSSWDFEDFVTPDKAGAKIRDQDQRHFGWSDDDEVSGNFFYVRLLFAPQNEHKQRHPQSYNRLKLTFLQGDASPVRRPKVHLPRPDAKSQFELVDEATPMPEKKQPAVIARNSQALNLYADPVFGGADEEEETAANKSKALQSTVNVNNQARGKDFGAHYDISDVSPALAMKTESNGNGQHKPEVRKKGPSHLDSHWGMYAEPHSGRKENVPMVKNTGDGMGGRKNSSRGWGIGDESDEEGVRTHPKRRPGEKEKTFWDF